MMAIAAVWFAWKVFIDLAGLFAGKPCSYSYLASATSVYATNL